MMQLLENDAFFLPLSAAVILATACYALCANNNALRNAAPSLCLSVGLLFTFIGIGLSLRAINPAQGVDAIMALMNGLKTAFWSSVMGLSCSIVLKSILLHRQPTQPTPAVFLDTLGRRHQTIIDKMDDFAETVATRLGQTLSSSVDRALAELPARIEQAGREFAAASDRLCALNAAHQVHIDNWHHFLDEYKTQNEAAVAALTTAIAPFTEAMAQQQAWFEQAVEGMETLAALKAKAEASLDVQARLLTNYGDLATHIETTFDKQQQAYVIEINKLADNITQEVQKFDVAIADQFKKQLDHQDQLLTSLLENISAGVAKESEESLARLAAAMRNIIDCGMQTFTETAMQVDSINLEMKAQLAQHQAQLETVAQARDVASV
ncbi:MAG: hypothetical protein KTR20_13845 [Cellvibrionaceae bacterium]|nr:hypothetical protein [Cellvibrionaceae bacterium]